MMLYMFNHSVSRRVLKFNLSALCGCEPHAYIRRTAFATRHSHTRGAYLLAVKIKRFYFSRKFREIELLMDRSGCEAVRMCMSACLHLATTPRDAVEAFSAQNGLQSADAPCSVRVQPMRRLLCGEKLCDAREMA